MDTRDQRDVQPDGRDLVSKLRVLIHDLDPLQGLRLLETVKG